MIGELRGAVADVLVSAGLEVAVDMFFLFPSGRTFSSPAGRVAEGSVRGFGERLDQDRGPVGLPEYWKPTFLSIRHLESL